MKRYISRPVEVEAVQLTPTNLDDVAEYIRLAGGDATVITHRHRRRLSVSTSKGPKLGHPGGYLVVYPNGRFYPLGGRKFHAAFTEIDGTQQTPGRSPEAPANRCGVVLADGWCHRLMGHPGDCHPVGDW